MTPLPMRQPHASVTDPDVRREKANKIADIIRTHRPIEGSRLLEVGCGSGYISAAFATMVGKEGKVSAVDRVDQLQTRAGFEFSSVETADLPFPSDEFDIVVSNHVMEHVGDLRDQVQHLREIARVMKPEGIAYIAVPNKWRVIEPHFRLPLLSWLPANVASAYVRLVGRGEWYDVVPPSRSRMPVLFAAADLDWDDYTLASLAVMSRVESVGPMSRAVARLPVRLLRAGLPFVPTMIYLARKRP